MLQTLKDLKEMGLKGIEAFSSYHTPELDEKFLQLGLELGLLITAGSDFHGEYKPKVAMGGIPETDYPIEENLEKAGFFLHRQKRLSSETVQRSCLQKDCQLTVQSF